jgi:hypothetical protein
MKNITVSDKQKATIKALTESLKELGRIFLIATVPLLIDAIEKNRFDWRFIVGAGIVAVLKSIDKFIHIYGEETKNDSLELGLTRF